MKKIFTERVRVNLSGNISSGGKTYEGLIENVSTEGMEYLMSSSIKVSKDFIPEKTMEVNFETPSGSKLNLTCDVICFLRPETENKKIVFGMKILEPPPQYVEFIDTLNPGDVNKKWE
jgi:hypothetical protein